MGSGVEKPKISKHIQATYAVPTSAQLGIMSDGSEAAIAAANNAAKRNIFGWLEAVN